MTNPEVGVLMLGIFVLTIALGFPIWITLMAMAMFFGYHAMGPRILDLLTQNAFSVYAASKRDGVPFFKDIVLLRAPEANNGDKQQ